MKDSKAVNCNGSEIMDQFIWNMGKGCQEKLYPGEIVPREIVPNLNGYDFSGDIVPWVPFHQRYRTQGTILQRYRTLFLQCYFRILSSRKVHLHLRII